MRATLGYFVLENASVDGFVNTGCPRCAGPPGLSSVDIDVAVRIAGDLLDGASAHCGSGGIGSVSSLRHDDFGACRVVARPMVGADHGNAGNSP